MCADRFTFQTMAELRAFETGVWFSEMPVTTETDGLMLTVRGEFGSGVSEHEYDPAMATLESNELGDRLLTSHVRFHSSPEATAFAAGLAWYGGAFANVDQCGTEVVVQQTRPDIEDETKLTYQYEGLRSLIAAHRACIRPDSLSA